jgi:2-succinyl-5-enolpyruvyl-6-hydroxy-3-cyclohexene-1-carboxylate synthase
VTGRSDAGDAGRERIVGPENEGDLALACVSLLVDELVRGGMEHACISPGSRSTPIALALDRHPGVTTHVHLDERASAFFALGMSKATRRPTAVACTSGTAAAELFPAVVEASLSRTPLVLLTADRPPALRGTGANQTIDQVELYGRYVRRHVETPLPEGGPRAAGQWRSVGRRVTASALGALEPAADASIPPVPGPVHVNLPFREPLAPTGQGMEVGRPHPEGDGPGGRDRQTPAVAESVAADIAGVERGVILAGGMPSRHDSIAHLAAVLGWPLVADPTSQLRRPGSAVSAGQALLHGPRSIVQNADTVLHFGWPSISRASQRLLASARRVISVDLGDRKPDPGIEAHLVVQAAPHDVAELLIARTTPQSDSRWLGSWERADGIARKTIDRLIDSWEEPFEGRIARDVAAAVPEGGTLVCGSSMPIRDLDYYMAPHPGLRVLANRGASGIDGFVSTALGVAAASQGETTYALMGDLTLLHDAGSLLWSGRRDDLNLVIVVPNNQGGVIFSFLPQRELPEHERLFTTPHHLDLGDLARAARVGHDRIDHSDELVPAIRRATEAGGVRIVETTVDGNMNVARHGEVRTAVNAELANPT